MFNNTFWGEILMIQLVKKKNVVVEMVIKEGGGYASL